MSDKRESYIEKSIEMLIKTGDFENIRIAVKVGETIEWSTPKERKEKVDNIREDLKRQFASDLDDILKSFELEDRTKNNERIKKEKFDSKSKKSVPITEDEDIEL